MAISEAISLVPPDPETPSTSHAHSDQGFLPSSPDPALASSGLDHSVLDKLQKLDLKEEGEDDGEPDEVQKLDSIEKAEEDGAGELQKVDSKAEDGAGELQKVEFSEGVEVPLNPTSIPSPAPSDRVPEILDWIRTLDPAVLNRIRNGDPALLHEIQQFDPAVEIRNFDPSIVIEIRNFDPAFPSDLKAEEDGAGELQKVASKAEEGGEGVEEEEKSSGEQEVEIVNGENNERQSEQSDGGEGWEGNQGWEEDGGGVEEKKAVETQESNRRYQYPVRPEAEDCSYYLKTGSCKFGSNCKFNHPVRRKPNQVPKERVKDKDESAENPSQTECKYYLRSGGCKYGENCRYSHSREKPSVAPVPELNFLGLPIRPGERECPYYMRNGSCKYASNCRFNHPDPTATGGSDPPSGYGNGGPASLQGASQSTVAPWSAPRPLNEAPVYSTLIIPPPQVVPTATGGSDPPSGYGNVGPASLQGASQSTVAPWSAPRPLNEAPVYSTLMIPPPQVVSSQNSEWNGYQGPAYVPERSIPARPPYMMNNSVAETNVYKQYPHQNQVEEFPERPGQPLCSYFLRTGDCKFKSNCKYHHPKNHTAVAPPIALSDKGLPLRPDQNICTHYSRYGICKFGPACKFDHPLHISSSTTSGPDHQLPFSDSATTNGPGMAASRNGTDVTSQPQPVQ